MGFHAPEFDGELSATRRSSIARRSAIYCDLQNPANSHFSRVATLTLPAGWPLRFLYGMRPVAGLRGFNGMSWFTCAAYKNDDPLNPGTTEIWLLGAGPDPAHRVARRLDTGAGADRFSPRTAIGARDVFSYYTRNDGTTAAQLRLASTGLALPDRESPSGFASLAYQWSHTAGGADPFGTAMLGTETTHFAVHGGALFAAQGSDGNPAIPGSAAWSGAQILVKVSPSAPWVVDESFVGHLSVEAMDSFAFTRSGLTPLQAGPQSVLVASLSDFSAIGANVASVRLRRPGGDWVDSHPNNSGAAFVSAFGFHADDGVTPSGDNVYAGLSNGEIHRGFLIDGANSNLDWTAAANPELSGTGPVTSFAEANAVLYAACGLRQEHAGAAVSGGLYRRVDGADLWTLVYRWPGPAPLHTAPAPLRVMTGLTTVRDPRGTSGEVLIGARSWPGVIERIDPARDHAVTVELDVRDFFARRWNDDTVRSQDVAIGYTRFAPATDPLTGKTVHLIGVWIEHPASAAAPHNGSHFLIRHEDATYEAAEIGNYFSPQLPAGQTLRATRAIAVSPFAPDHGLALYFGGFDAAADEVQNTAWIVRGDWTAFPPLTISRPNPPGFQLTWPSTDLDWIVESSPTLTLPNWLPVAAKPTRSPDVTTLAVPAQPASRFYRLRRQ